MWHSFKYSFFKNNSLFCVPACKFVHCVHAEASRGQKSISEPLKLKLETVISQNVLEIEPRFSTRATRLLATEPAPQSLNFHFCLLPYPWNSGIWRVQTHWGFSRGGSSSTSDSTLAVHDANEPGPYRKTIGLKDCVAVLGVRGDWGMVQHTQFRDPTANYIPRGL